MVGLNDVDMETEGSQYYQTPDSQPSTSNTNESAPSWASQILRLLTQLIGIQSSTRQPPCDQRPGHSQPHPEKFSGFDPTLYPQFRSLLEAKLQIDTKAIGNEAEKVWYGLLETQKKITKAINKLNTIKQGNRDFREFLQDFEQTILEAQGWGWDDQIKKGYLRTALNRELSDRLVSQDEPVGYEDFVSQLRRTSDKMEVIKTWNDRRNRSRGLNPQSTQTLSNEPIGDPMDWEPTQTINIANTQRNVMRQTQPDRETWVSREEIGRRIEAGLCLRCGRRGHVIKDCSLLPAYNPNRQGKNLSSKPKVTAASVSVDQEFEDVSGNEWNRFEKSMDCKPFIVNTFINDIIFASTLIDTGCLSYGLCDSHFAQKNNLVRLKINPREVVGFDGKIASSVNEVAVVNIDLDGHRQSKVFLYIAPLGPYDMILGMPWIASQDVRINGPRSEMEIR
ncbi:hypothetical protein Golomagni_04091 [Golovinomyces magnicellulatus]|nr:hypothetical protein Golomagni_04091 [Golovinomyces magnicellulatus]